MDRKEFLVGSSVASLGVAFGALGTAGAQPVPNEVRAGVPAELPAAAPARSAAEPTTRKILIAGGEFGTPFIRYLAMLTGKPRPRLCFLPTASADSPAAIISWYRACAPLAVEPYAQASFIESLSQAQGWDEVLLSMDGIVASGGNTLNQQAIWHAQGIDVVLREAWSRGIVLGGASAGSLCWFEEGTTDSRPKALSVVQCLGFLPGSHCPHYDAEPGRRPLYQRLIGSGQMKPGYACDNAAGLYFEGTEVKRVVASRDGAKAYYVSLVNGAVTERALEPERIA